MFCIEDEHFPSDLEGFLIKFPEISDFFTIFNSLVLEAPMELDKKLGHYEYLLLEKRSFPVSFVLPLQRTSKSPPTFGKILEQ